MADMNSIFNVGDRVIILDGRTIEASGGNPNWVEEMDELIGCEGEVINISTGMDDVYCVNAISPSNGEDQQFFYSASWLAYPDPFEYEEINVNDLFG